MKYIVNGKTYESTTNNPHGALRDILINVQLDGHKVEIVKD